MMWGLDGHMGWMWLSWVVGLVLLCLLVWAIVRVGTQSEPRTDDTPEAILKRRYARGDLDHEEFERRLADLRR